KGAEKTTSLKINVLLLEVQRRLEFQVHPLFGNRNAAHQASAICSNQEGVARIVTKTFFRIVEPRFDTERHSLAQHCVIAKCKPRFLMPFHPLTVSGPMINETSNTIFDLMLMHFVCKIRTCTPCYAFIQHDLHCVGYHLPDLI